MKHLISQKQEDNHLLNREFIKDILNHNQLYNQYLNHHNLKYLTDLNHFSIKNLHKVICMT